MRFSGSLIILAAANVLKEAENVNRTLPSQCVYLGAVKERGKCLNDFFYSHMSPLSKTGFNKVEAEYGKVREVALSKMIAIRNASETIAEACNPLNQDRVEALLDDAKKAAAKVKENSSALSKIATKYNVILFTQLSNGIGQVGFPDNAEADAGSAK